VLRATVAALHSEVQSARETATAAQRKQDAEVSNWQRSIKALREQLADAQMQLQRQQKKGATAIAADEELRLLRLQAQEQSRSLQSLQQQYATSQQEVSTLRAQLRRQSSTAAPSAPRTSGSLDPDAGLSALQQQQLALRSETERTLLKLQQLFPDQKIG